MLGLLSRSAEAHAQAVRRIAPGDFDRALGTGARVAAVTDVGLGGPEQAWQKVVPSQGLLGKPTPAAGWREMAALLVVAAAPEGTHAAALRPTLLRPLVRYPNGEQSFDLSLLASLPLRALALHQLHLRDVASLSRHRNLEHLEFAHCRFVPSLSALEGAPIRTLRIRECDAPLGDLRALPLAHVELVAQPLAPELQSDTARLTLSGTFFAPKATAFPRLEELVLDGLDHPLDLRRMPLRRLTLRRPTCLDVLAELPPGLQALEISTTAIPFDLGDIGNLQNLASLSLYRCRALASLDGLRNPQLTVLDLRGTAALRRAILSDRLPSLRTVALAGSGALAISVPKTAVIWPDDSPPNSPVAESRDARAHDRLLLSAEDVDVAVDALTEAGQIEARLGEVTWSCTTGARGPFEVGVAGGGVQGIAGLRDSVHHASYASLALLARAERGAATEVRATLASITVMGPDVDLSVLRAFPALTDLRIMGTAGARKMEALQNLPLLGFHSSSPLPDRTRLPPSLSRLVLPGSSPAMDLPDIEAVAWDAPSGQVWPRSLRTFIGDRVDGLPETLVTLACTEPSPDLARRFPTLTALRVRGADRALRVPTSTRILVLPEYRDTTLTVPVLHTLSLEGLSLRSSLRLHCLSVERLGLYGFGDVQWEGMGPTYLSVSAPLLKGLVPQLHTVVTLAVHLFGGTFRAPYPPLMQDLVIDARGRTDVNFEALPAGTRVWYCGPRAQFRGVHHAHVDVRFTRPDNLPAHLRLL